MRTLFDLPLLTNSVLLTGTVAEHRLVTFAGVYPAAGARAYGVTPDGGGSGDTAAVKVLGNILVESGAAIAAGVDVEADATGRVITRVAGVIIGFATNAAAAAGDPVVIVRSTI